MGSPSEIRIPETMPFLPIYCLGILKNPAFRLLGETKVDEKFAEIIRVLGLPMSHLI